MALVYRSEHKGEASSSPVGVGQYDVSPTKQIKPNPKAPAFDSRAARLSFEASNLCETGPGSYDPDASQLISPKKVQACHSVFNSKVERFKQNSHSQSVVDYENDEEPSDILRKPKRMFGIQERKNVKDKCNKQTFPSIPCTQQSFGYRLQAQTGRFVSNANPNILMTTTSDPFRETGVKTSPNYYFIKDSPKKGCVQWSKQSKADWETSLINSSRIEVMRDILEDESSRMYSKPKVSFNPINSKEPRFKANDGTTIKDTLLMRKMNQLYKDYITEAETPENALKERQSLIDCTPIKKVAESPNKILGTLPREKKIDVCQPDAKKASHPLKSNTRNSTDSTVQASEINAIKNQPENKNFASIGEHFGFRRAEHKSVGFISGSLRFPSAQKQNLGPGRYNAELNQSTPTPTLKLTEDRFKDIFRPIDYIPGPGAYKLTPGHLTKIVKPTQSRKEASQLLSAVIPSRSRTAKDEGFSEVKLGVPSTSAKSVVQKAPKAIKKPENPNEIEKRIRMAVGAGQTMQTAMDAHVHQVSVRAKNQKHLFSYSRPEAVEEMYGVGAYDIAGSMNKKTYNVSYA